MPVPPIPPIGGGTPAPGSVPAAPAAPAAGFAEALRQGIDAVRGRGNPAPAGTQAIGPRGPPPIPARMAATTKAQLSMDLLVQVRNRAVEAYQEIMRLQV
jgi:flagellar hook-basal body complex protein FliE